jgi:hemoglobin
MSKKPSNPPSDPQTSLHPTPVTLASLGGEKGILRWVTRFYDKVALHPLLSPMFHDLENSRKKQHAYFVEIFGGADVYTQQYGKPFLRFKHRHFRIGEPEREAWMHLVMESLREEIGEGPIADEVERRLGELAEKMINHRPEGVDSYYFHK